MRAETNSRNDPIWRVLNTAAHLNHLGRFKNYRAAVKTAEMLILQILNVEQRRLSHWIQASLYTHSTNLFCYLPTVSNSESYREPMHNKCDWMTSSINSEYIFTESISHACLVRRQATGIFFRYVTFKSASLVLMDMSCSSLLVLT